MCPTFTDDDVGKRVERANGTAIGTVAAVDGDTAHVETEPGVTDAIKAALGWESDREDTVPLDGSTVREITDDAIRLEENRAPDDGTAEGGHDSVVEQHEGAGERDVGAGPATVDEGDEGRAETEGDSGAARRTDAEETPPEGDQTVTEERGEKEDR